MKTIKAFTEQSNLNPKLIRAVIRQVGGFEAFKEIAEDVTNHGAACGFGGFIYYTETISFTKRNRAPIIELLTDLNLDIYGHKNYTETLISFNCLKALEPMEIIDGLHNSRSDYRTEVYNALAWFALEEVARDFINIVEG